MVKKPVKYDYFPIVEPKKVYTDTEEILDVIIAYNGLCSCIINDGCSGCPIKGKLGPQDCLHDETTLQIAKQLKFEIEERRRKFAWLQNL